MMIESSAGQHESATVSVILPTHNRAYCLKRAICSVLGQTHADLELIVVDDCSSDDTPSLLQTIRDPRLKVVRNERCLGVSASRNRGAREARGQFLAFQDSDDEWRAEKLSRQLAAFRDDTALVVCGNLYINAPLMSYQDVPADAGAVVDITPRVSQRLPGAPAFLVPRRLFEELEGFRESINCFEDWELALRLRRRGRILLANDPLLLQHRTPGSLFADWQNFSANLAQILDLHADSLRRDPRAWSRHRNLLGQMYCLFGHAAQGREQFRRAWREGASTPRTLLNWLVSWLGQRAFRRYHQGGRFLNRSLQSLRLAGRIALQDAKDNYGA